MNTLGTKCDKARTLTVDLFSNGKLYKSRVKLALPYDQSRVTSDLIDAARIVMSPTTQKMMGIVYVSETRPADLNSIPWNNYGTYVSGSSEPSYLVSCTRALEFQNKYVAINLSPAPLDETLKMDIYWRGNLIKQDYELPIHYVHGERVFGVSRVNFAEAVREAIPPDLLLTYDITIQFMNRRVKPDLTAQPIDWSARKQGVTRLMAKWDQIKKLQKGWVAVNVEPVMTIQGLTCDFCCLFDAVFQHNESKQFYCSKQCFLDEADQ